MFRQRQIYDHVYRGRGLGLGGGLGRGQGLGLGRGQGNGLGRGRGRGSGVGAGLGLGISRRRVDRNICGAPVSTYFKPNGIPVTELDVIHLGLDEFEAMRLKNIEELDQMEASKKMEISQSTFARILDSAYKKISTALINGKAIEIDTEL